MDASTTVDRGLWACPRCERTFANVKQTHTCEPLGDLDRHFAGASPAVREAFDRVLGVVTAIYRAMAARAPGRHQQIRNQCAADGHMTELGLAARTRSESPRATLRR